MAPPHKSVAELGTVAEHGNGWRARVKLDGQYRDGPQRATCAEAQADLDAARQCTSREEMSKFLTSGAQSMKRPRQMDPLCAFGEARRWFILCVRSIVGASC